MRAIAKNVRISPRKARLVADLVRAKNALTAVQNLEFVNKKAAPLIKKVILSAIANARSKSKDVSELILDKVCIDAGTVMKRTKPISRGRTHIILKRTSHIKIELK